MGHSIRRDDEPPTRLDEDVPVLPKDLPRLYADIPFHYVGPSLSDSEIGQSCSEWSKDAPFLKLVVFSDTHGEHDHLRVPDGDVLIFAGDMSWFRNWLSGVTDRFEPTPAVDSFNEFIGRCPHRVKIVIAGNHDFFDKCAEYCNPHEVLSNATYLCDAEYVLDVADVFPEKNVARSVKFFGTPWTDNVCMAYGVGSNPDSLAPKWELIPDDVDVLITHVPPFGILDRYQKRGRCSDCCYCGEIHNGCYHCGNQPLRRKIEDLAMNHQLQVHCFGHVHHENGIVVDSRTGVVYLNGAVKENPRVLSYPFRLERETV